MKTNILSGNRLIKRRLKLSIIPSIVFVSIVWLVFIVDYTQIFEFNFSRLGIYPLKYNGLLGIVFSPFIHSSFSHLISNTVPLLILITLMFFFYNQIAVKSIIVLWFVSGVFTWFIGRNAYHIGASGLIFALVFFLFFSGLLRRYVPLSAVSMIVAFIYGSTVWSIFPVAELVDISLSWEGHLSGAIAGLIVALIYRKEGPQKPQILWDEEDVEDNLDKKDFWIDNPKDTFDEEDDAESII